MQLRRSVHFPRYESYEAAGVVVNLIMVHGFGVGYLGCRRGKGGFGPQVEISV